MRLLNPTYEARVKPTPAPPRLSSLAGARVGIISNGKEKTAPFFDAVSELLTSRYQVAEVIRRIKPNYSAPAPAELMAEVRQWDAALAGVGD